MTNAISSLPTLPLVPDTAAHPTGKPPPGADAPTAGPAAAQAEAATISVAAQVTTQMLNAARDSAGIDHAAVNKIRTALQNGQYNVTPETLAQAIATVLKETK
ncbi:MAG: flagellar biosynthesis anti-sigma factor FlgM [Acidocella sp.]|nr:flagellar biosynthesis anti-sigma factor FlgM [Acidocella sp.]